MVRLTVLTYNIRHGRGTDDQLNLNRIAEVIHASNADIIGLNEVDAYFSSRSEYEDQVKWLAEYLNMDYEFGASVTHEQRTVSGQDRQYGNAILSRYPIQKHQTHLFQPKWMKEEDRSVLEATIKIEEHLMDVFVSHLSLSPWFSQRQKDFIIERANASEKNGKKVLILGDWNMRPRSRRWRELHRSYKDAWYEYYEDQHDGRSPFLRLFPMIWPFFRYGHTFPSSHPLIRLDYIFVSHCLQVDDAEVLKVDPKASDHLPVKVSLTLDQ